MRFKSTSANFVERIIQIYLKNILKYKKRKDILYFPSKHFFAFPFYCQIEIQESTLNFSIGIATFKNEQNKIKSYRYQKENQYKPLR